MLKKKYVYGSLQKTKQQQEKTDFDYFGAKQVIF